MMVITDEQIKLFDLALMQYVFTLDNDSNFKPLVYSDESVILREGNEYLVLERENQLYYFNVSGPLQVTKPMLECKMVSISSCGNYFLTDTQLYHLQSRKCFERSKHISGDQYLVSIANQDYIGVETQEKQSCKQNLCELESYRCLYVQKCSKYIIDYGDKYISTLTLKYKVLLTSMELGLVQYEIDAGLTPNVNSKVVDIGGNLVVTIGTHTLVINLKLGKLTHQYGGNCGWFDGIIVKY